MFKRLFRRRKQYDVQEHFLASCVAAMIIAVPAGLRADTDNAIPDPEKVQDIANHLSTLEEHAAGVTRDAETVRSLAQDHHTNWQSHAYYLNNLRDDVNGMGELLAELETMKPLGSGAQQMAIERSRPHLVALAAETTEALNLLRARAGNVMQPQYKETVAELASQAEILYQTLDTIVDYHNADDRLDNLEASHSGSGI